MPSATTRGVAPSLAILSTINRTSPGTTPPSPLTYASMASAAPLRI